MIDGIWGPILDFTDRTWGTGCPTSTCSLNGHPVGLLTPRSWCSPIIFCSQMEQLHCSLPDLCLLALLLLLLLQNSKKIVALLPPPTPLCPTLSRSPCSKTIFPSPVLQKILYLSIMISAFLDQKSSYIVRWIQKFWLIEEFSLR